jgi:hypothetical protein
VLRRTLCVGYCLRAVVLRVSSLIKERRPAKISPLPRNKRSRKLTLRRDWFSGPRRIWYHGPHSDPSSRSISPRRELMRTRYIASSTELSPYVACRLEFHSGALAAKPESPIMPCVARAAAACKAERSALLYFTAV